LFVFAVLLDTLETVRVYTWQYSRVRVHFCTDRTFHYVVQLLRCRHFRLAPKQNKEGVRLLGRCLTALSAETGYKEFSQHT